MQLFINDYHVQYQEDYSSSRIDVTATDEVKELIDRLVAIAQTHLSEEQIAYQNAKKDAELARKEADEANAKYHDLLANFKPYDENISYTVGDLVLKDGKPFYVEKSGTSTKLTAVNTGGATATGTGTATVLKNKGDEIIFKRKKYRSLIDGNIWSPEEKPDAWELVE